jgi:hypothetical protein
MKPRWVPRQIIRARRGEGTGTGDKFSYVDVHDTTEKPTRQLFCEKRISIPVVDHLQRRA